ncbi:MAG: tyrosine--tRNA ligase, partial [Chloroflexota bacterium]
KPQIAVIMGASLPGTDGSAKMSKSTGNHIPLLSEPWDMYGKVMSLPDEAMELFHKLVLGWQDNQLKELTDGITSGDLHPNDAKMNLSREIVTIFHGKDGAEGAQKRWDETFRSDGDGIPEDIPEKVLSETKRLIDVLRDNDLVSSGREAKDLAKNDGIRLDGEKIDDVGQEITPDSLPVVVQVGKRKFLRLISE